MQAKEALKLTLTSTKAVLDMYLTDLADADLLVQPVPNSNSIAWQMGHLIAAEKRLLEKELPGATYPELPAVFEDQLNAKSPDATPRGGFLRKADYLEWFDKVRKATLANVDRLSDADFDKPNTGRMAAMAPNLGALIVLVANHTLMHAGQFTVVRRALKKPVLF